MIFIFNPYVSAGGGQSIQEAFSKVLNCATDVEVFKFKRLRNFIKPFFTCNGKKVLIVQSIYSLRSLILILFVRIIKLIGVNDVNCIIIPRGDRLPYSVRDNLVKSSFKKYLYKSFFLFISGNMCFIFSSAAEADHYLSQKNLKSYNIIPDPNSHPNYFDALPCRIEVQKFVFLGRLSYEKNINFIIDIFQQRNIKNLNLQLYLYVIANEDERICLQKRLASDENIHVCAPLKAANQVFQVLHSSVVLNPSYYESFGLVPLEAIAAGAAFISSPVGEWQTDNSAGRVIGLERDAWTGAILDYHTNGIENNKLDRVNILRKFDPSEVKLKWAKVMKGYFNND